MSPGMVPCNLSHVWCWGGGGQGCYAGVMAIHLNLWSVVAGHGGIFALHAHWEVRMPLSFRGTGRAGSENEINKVGVVFQGVFLKKKVRVAVCMCHFW